MNSQIERTGLWKRSLGEVEADADLERCKVVLRGACQRFRERAAALTSRISATFPELTVHDITHLDALWEVADLIAGADYPLNPMEAFVFCGAVLLHDAAHCFEAYSGGRDAVRETSAWKDAYAAEVAAQPDGDSETLKRNSDFSAVRVLHAQQAERLALEPLVNSPDEFPLFLIEDSNLRARYGRLIGMIAASHHWDIEDVSDRLRDQVNAPGSWPQSWRVDPIKLACLLRCADAAHIDDRRAPDVLLALVRRSGISLDHWKAQNWLSRPDIDLSDASRSSLLFTSTQPFKAADSNSWWVAYDAISVVDTELKTSYATLNSRPFKNSGSPPFAIRQVAGANQPVKLSEYIETEGWQPTSAVIHVSNLERLVRTLGGESLYGANDNFAIVTRELIQNARDAIAARKGLQAGHKGRIIVRVSSKTDKKTLIEVRDDGIGMSERTMTGPLLDFGQSFWSSSLLRSEFPGLRSSSFRPVGKFGIGFYSIFMLASAARVSSRRYDSAHSDMTNFDFPSGLSLRPTLSKGAATGYDGSYSTSVQLTLDEGIADVRFRTINKGNTQFEAAIPLNEYLAALTTALDVDVQLQIEDGDPVKIHTAIEDLHTLDDLEKWLRLTAFVDSLKGRQEASKIYIRENVERMRRVEQDGNLVGFAALLDTEGRELSFLSADTIGGLTSQIARGASSYMGYFEVTPASAKRDSGKKVARPETLQAWAIEQVAILREANATPVQLYWAASNLSNLELDPIEVISYPIFLSGITCKLMQWGELFQLLEKTPIACAMSPHVEFFEVNLPPIYFGDFPTLRPLSAGSLIQLAVEDGVPKFPFSLIGCLARRAAGAGRELIFEKTQTFVTGPFGQVFALLIRLKPLA